MLLLEREPQLAALAENARDAGGATAGWSCWPHRALEIALSEGLKGTSRAFLR